MAKNILVYDLLELYGSLLTQKQLKMLEYYYFDDFSLSEIAENEGGSRQGIQNMIKRAEKELINIEKNLGLYERTKKQKAIIEQLKFAAENNDTDTVKICSSQLEQTL